MTTKKTENNFYKDWQALQASFGKLKKDTKNPFYKSNYVTLNQVLEVVKKNCAEHNFAFFQVPLFDTTPFLQTVISHIPSNEKIVGEIPLVSKDSSDPQKLGSALTYMRRYSLVCMFNLEDEDDDGNKSSTPAKKKEEDVVWFDPKNKSHLKAVSDYRASGDTNEQIIKKIRAKMAISKVNTEKILINTY